MPVYRPTNREHHLGFLMSRFKGGTGYIYGKMRREGAVEDIGEHLWQFDYWDNLITSESELAGIRKLVQGRGWFLGVGDLWYNMRV